MSHKRKNEAKPMAQIRAVSKSSEAKSVASDITDGDCENARLSEFSKRKRQQIIDAALETFFELGYEGASMNLVADRAGVIKQTIYSHFKDKEGLFLSVISSVTTDYAQPLFEKQVLEKLTPEQVLRRWAETFKEMQSKPTYLKLFRTIIGESARFPKLAELYTKATIKPGLEMLSTYLREHPQVNLPDAEAFARVYIGTLISYRMQQSILHGHVLYPFDYDRMVDELIRLFNLSCNRST